MTTHDLAYLTAGDIVLDALPESVQATMRVRDKWFNSRGDVQSGFEFIVSDLQRWTPGQTVRVAFLGGTPELHAEIESATESVTSACNLVLDFRNAATGGFRSWSEQDEVYAAEIRVSFDQGGYFSLVGTDSVNPAIGAPLHVVGGRPGQRSLNLGGFTFQKPAAWRGVVRHEFLHALSFHHSHQNMRGPCQQEFRWDDDRDYQPTQDAQGRFVPDSEGRRPGIYTYLAGFPNFWSAATVDHNLKTEEDPSVVAGPFDRASVMLYRFPELFYKSLPSSCAPTGEGIDLSDGDKRGLRLLYPTTAPERDAAVERQRSILADLEGDRSSAREGFEVASPVKSQYAHRAVTILKQTLADAR
jgi:hypothetical protein